jgi:hypothetical protein
MAPLVVLVPLILSVGLGSALNALAGATALTITSAIDNESKRSSEAWISAINPVTSPAAPRDSAQPQITVEGDRAVLSWIEREGTRATLKFAEWTERRASSSSSTSSSASASSSGATSTKETASAAASTSVSTAWSEAQTVSSGDNFFVNWADVPSVRALADGSLAAHWLQKSGPGTYAYDVKLSFSKDRGRTWTPAVSPHSDGMQTEHGFASLFQAPGAGAGLGLVWLDGRAMKSGSHGTGAAAGSKPAGAAGGAGSGGVAVTPTAGGAEPAGGNAIDARRGDAGGSKAAVAGHGDGDRGAMTVRAATFGADGVQRSETLVDARVCECCPTTAAVTSEGVIAAFRNRAEGEIRDIYVSRLDGSTGKWSEPAAVHNDNWMMPACPVNGPSLSASGRRVAIAWFTMQQDQGHAFVAFSDDAGHTFGKPVRVDDEMSLGRVDIELLPDGSAVTSWIEYSTAGSTTSFRIRRIERSGTLSPPITVTSIGSGRTSGYPRMARVGHELLFAWTDTAAAPRLATARARLTPPVASSAQQ